MDRAVIFPLAVVLVLALAVAAHAKAPNPRQIEVRRGAPLDLGHIGGRADD